MNGFVETEANKIGLDFYSGDSSVSSTITDSDAVVESLTAISRDLFWGRNRANNALVMLVTAVEEYINAEEGSDKEELRWSLDEALCVARSVLIPFEDVYEDDEEL
jgi:hypothetical protein